MSDPSTIQAVQFDCGHRRNGVRNLKPRTCGACGGARVTVTHARLKDSKVWMPAERVRNIQADYRTKLNRGRAPT